MRSPFAGMDPFIEAYGLWEDFHPHLIEGMYQVLADAVPERYVVRAGERTYVIFSEGDDERRLFKPDVGISAVDRPSASAASGVTTATEPPPIAMHAFLKEEVRETFIEIRDGDGEIITCIEVLSPTNKRRGGPGRRDFLAKRRAYLSGEANFVELDLLRGGKRMPMVEPWPDSPYYLLVSRRETAPLCSVWRAFAVQPLPALPIPLAPPDADISLALQPLISGIYQRSRYFRSIDYAAPRSLRLLEEEKAILSSPRQ
jgi:hypothetical protein